MCNSIQRAKVMICKNIALRPETLSIDIRRTAPFTKYTQLIKYRSLNSPVFNETFADVCKMFEE